MRLFEWILAARSRLPEGELVYAIGDIHGRDDLLAMLHKSIEVELGKDYPGCNATVVYLGDYIDRGPNSRAVVDRLLDNPVRGARSIWLKGNHEDALLRFLESGEGEAGWFSMGGGATARSYGLSFGPGVCGPDPPVSLRNKLKEAIPERHIEFLLGLRLLYESGDYLFVHAGLRPGLAVEDQVPRDLLWIRQEFLKSRRNHGKLVVHGHAASLQPVVKRNRICVDTAAHATDRLTALVLKDDTRRFLCAEL